MSSNVFILALKYINSCATKHSIESIPNSRLVVFLEKKKKKQPNKKELHGFWMTGRFGLWNTAKAYVQGGFSSHSPYNNHNNKLNITVIWLSHIWNKF